jgi:hypothetical protein
MRGWRWIGAVALVAAGIGAVAGCSDPKADASNLRDLDEIALGDLAGTDAQIGATRSELLPVVVRRRGPGETSLSIVDAHRGAVTDAGPIPVDGWATNVFPRASDRYVAVLVNVCREQPYEGDAGDECGEAPLGEGPPPVELAVYDIDAGTWASVRLSEPDGASVSLVDVDGTTAVLERSRERDDDPALWSEVDLSKRLTIGPFAEGAAPRPNGLVDSLGHFDGWGWKASGAEGWEDDTTWTGTVGGRPVTETIANAGDHRFAGAGRCLVVGTYRPSHLDHLHRLCAS